MAKRRKYNNGEPVWVEADCAPHPTTNVLACSPDKVLTHDGVTSHACRGCDCGQRSAHEYGCKTNRGPILPPGLLGEFHSIVRAKVSRYEDRTRKLVLDELSDRYGLVAQQRTALMEGRDR